MNKCLNCPLEDEGLKAFLEALNFVRTVKHRGKILVTIKDDEIMISSATVDFLREPTIKARVKKEKASG